MAADVGRHHQSHQGRQWWVQGGLPKSEALNFSASDVRRVMSKGYWVLNAGHNSGRSPCKSEMWASFFFCHAKFQNLTHVLPCDRVGADALATTIGLLGNTGKYTFVLVKFAISIHPHWMQVYLGVPTEKEGEARQTVEAIRSGLIRIKAAIDAK